MNEIVLGFISILRRYEHFFPTSFIYLKMLFIDDIPIGFGSLNFEQLMTSVKRFVIRVKLQLIICTRKFEFNTFS